jgi:hypothetical protein
MTTPAFASLEEAFLYCRDMDASLSERLDAFSSATRYLIPGYQEAVDRMVNRLKAYDAGQTAPKPGEKMPPFAMPDEQGHMVTLDDPRPHRYRQRLRFVSEPCDFGGRRDAKNPRIRRPAAP